MSELYVINLNVSQPDQGPLSVSLPVLLQTNQLNDYNRQRK